MKTLFIGETCTISQTFHKGFDHITVGRYEEAANIFIKNLTKLGYQIDLMRIHEVQQDTFPDTPEKLAKYDVIILSDIGSNTFSIPQKMHFNCIRMPNRLQAIKQYVLNGGALMMCGGYLSFTGYEGKARWGMTPVADILPVKLLPYDDRMEHSEGISFKITDTTHPITTNITGPFPYFFGYNKCELKPGAQLIMQLENDDILCAAHEIGKGRSLVWTTDCLPHWLPPQFWDWPDSAKMFGNMLTWLAKDKK